MDINHKAPAAASSEELIKAPVNLVWQILTDLNNWPGWNPEVKQVELNGPIEAGTRFRWKAGSASIISRLEEVSPPRRIVWSGKTFGINAIHVWELKEENGATRVKSEESFEGLIVRVFSTAMRKMLTKSLNQGIGALKAESERRAKMASHNPAPLRWPA